MSRLWQTMRSSLTLSSCNKIMVGHSLQAVLTSVPLLPDNELLHLPEGHPRRLCAL